MSEITKKSIALRLLIIKLQNLVPVLELKHLSSTDVSIAVEVIESQAKEIEALKAEVGRLSNPWVKIDEFESNMSDDEVEVLVFGHGLSVPVLACRRNGRWWIDTEYWLAGIQYWMPIPPINNTTEDQT